MSDLAPPVALDYIPVGIGRKQLYSFLGPLIDYALKPSEGVNDTVLDPLVKELILDYADPEAVNAYLNMLVHPIAGTRRAMDYALDLLGISPALVEWWQPALQSPYDAVPPTGHSDRPYHFTVTFPDGTLPKGPFSYRDLIRMLLALKNERSKLIAVRMADCVDMITLDNDCNLDMYYLDSLEGFVDPVTGVVICLHEDFTQAVDNSEHVNGQLHTTLASQLTHAFPQGLLDYMVFGDDASVDQGSIQTYQYRTSDRVTRLLYYRANYDVTTGQMIKEGGRTSIISRTAGGADIQTHPHNARTSDSGQRIPLSLTPTVLQTIPLRSVTQAVPRTAFYRQRTWVDVPDGTQGALSTVVFYLSEAAYQGDAVAQIKVNGSVIATVTVTAANLLSQSQPFSFTGAYGLSNLTLEVSNTNAIAGSSAANSRSLYWDAVTVNGTKTAISKPLVGSATTYSTVLPLRRPQGSRTWIANQIWVSDQPQAYLEHTSEAVGVIGSADLLLYKPSETTSGATGEGGCVSLAMARPTAVAVGKALPSARAAIVLPAPRVSVHGVHGDYGQGSAVIGRPTATGIGLLVAQGIGTGVLNRPTADGSDIATASSLILANAPDSTFFLTLL